MITFVRFVVSMHPETTQQLSQGINKYIIKLFQLNQSCQCDKYLDEEFLLFIIILGTQLRHNDTNGLSKKKFSIKFNL